MAYVPVEDPQFVSLARAITDARTGSPVVIAAVHFYDGTPSAAVEHLLRCASDRSVKFQPFPGFSSLTETEARTAAGGLAEILRWELAYSHEVMPPAVASDLAHRFVAWCGPGKWFTNGDFPGSVGKCRGWNPATTSTFDAGVLFCGRSLVAVVWCIDED